MKKILVIKNIEHEGLGLLAEVIKSTPYIIEEVEITALSVLPDLDMYAALIMLGGPASANDNTPAIQSSLALVKTALELKTPFLGICLGMQLLAKAAGAEVIKAPTKEIGFVDQTRTPFKINLTSEGRADRMFDGLGQSFSVFQLHGETVTLNSNIRLLATAKTCTHQVIKVGSCAYGIQCHFELTKEMFEQWLQLDADLKLMNHPSLLNQFDELWPNYRETGITLFKNFINQMA